MLKEKRCICVLWTQRKLLTEYQKKQWEMRKKGIPEILVRSVMSLNEGAKTRVIKRFDFLEEFEVKVGMHQESELHLW